MPEDMDPEAAKHITPVLKQVMSKILHGGGLGKAGLNFASLFLQLQGVAMNYQLCIPPYFTNVLRAFGTIEGIALKADPTYSIIQVGIRLSDGWMVKGGASSCCQSDDHSSPTM